MATKKQAGLAYSVSVLLFILFAGYFQRNDIFSGLMFTEIVLILMPSIIILYFAKNSTAVALKIRRVPFVQYIIAGLIMIFALPIAGVFNYCNIIIVNGIFGKVQISSLPSAQGIVQVLFFILVFALFPAVCEEFLCRGVIQGSMEEKTPVKAIVLAALLFSLMHLDITKILGTFVLGLLIGYISYKTKSIFPAIFAHFTNNTIAVVLDSITNDITAGFENLPSMEEYINPELLPDGSNIYILIALLIVVLLVLVIFGSILFGFIFWLRKSTEKNISKIKVIKDVEETRGAYMYIPGIVITVLYFMKIIVIYSGETSWWLSDLMNNIF